jgi:ribonuclease HI
VHVVERASKQLVVFLERQERHRFVSNQRCAVSLTLWLIQNFADGSLPSFEIGRKVHVVRGKYKDETGEIFKLTPQFAYIKVKVDGNSGDTLQLKCRQTSLVVDSEDLDDFDLAPVKQTEAATASNSSAPVNPAENSDIGALFTVFTDGASKGNPGLGSCGAVIKDSGNSVIASRAAFLGVNVTNNEAEYDGLLMGLRLAEEMGCSDNLMVCMDSQLIVRQMLGENKVEKMRIKYNEAKVLEQAFGQIQYKHVPREKNYLADSLANGAIDEWRKEQAEINRPPPDLDLYPEEVPDAWLAKRDSSGARDFLPKDVQAMLAEQDKKNKKTE